ncbi:MAG: hypothetical protein AAF371_02835 [Pseudomonadota bacterium]
MSALGLPDQSNLLLIAALVGLTSLYLLARAWFRRRRSRQTSRRIVIDGSNVMHWADGVPQIRPVREVVKHLRGLGFTPGVIFDANAGYLIRGKYQHDKEFEKLLGLPRGHVMVVDKGAPADPTILAAAKEFGSRVVTNDRYRDWAAQYPDVYKPGFLIRGGYRQGRLWLDLDRPEGSKKAGATERIEAR